MIKTYLKISSDSHNKSIPETAYFTDPKVVPKQGEQIQVSGQLYQVDRVILSLDEEEIKTVLEIIPINTG